MITISAQEEADRRYPPNYTVEDPFGAIGAVAVTDPYGYDEVANRAFVAGAEWATADRANELVGIRAKQATLPDGRDEDTIDRMKVGESGFVVPWGMWVDLERRCWLHPKYQIRSQAGGTVKMRVERRADGFHVWLPRVSSWTPTADPGYMSPIDTVYIPVAVIEEAAAD